jgi:hypothetical protein
MQKASQGAERTYDIGDYKTGLVAVSTRVAQKRRGKRLIWRERKERAYLRA